MSMNYKNWATTGWLRPVTYAKLSLTHKAWSSPGRGYFCEFYNHESVSMSCSTDVSAEEMRIKLKTKRGLSRLRQVRKYCKTAKDVLELVKVTLTHLYISTMFLTIS